MKRKDFLKEMRGLTTEDLLAKEIEVAKANMSNRFAASRRDLGKTSDLKKFRRDYARILTVKNERKSDKTIAGKKG